MPAMLIDFHPQLPGKRALQAVLMFSLLAVTGALFAQHALGWQPCAWCVAQRVIFLMLMASSTLALLAGARTSAALAALGTAVLAMAGTAAAYYQATVASSAHSCDMSLADRWLAASGLAEIAPPVFGVYASCAQANVSLLGLEFAWWAFGAGLFVATLALIAFWQVVRGPVSRRLWQA